MDKYEELNGIKVDGTNYDLKKSRDCKKCDLKDKCNKNIHRPCRYFENPDKDLFYIFKKQS